MDGLLAALARLSLAPACALSERVAPLLHHAAPERSCPLLRKAYYDTAARNLVLLEGLEEVKRRLASRAIAPVVLKGADLATSLYPSLALRPMSDVDLWVRRCEVARAEEALRALGYRAGVPEMRPGIARSIKHARLYVGGPGGAVALDLHWSLVGHERDGRAPDLGWFRDRARSGRLDPTAHLLYLAAHMKLQHYDERPPLLWLADFYLLSRVPGVDWAALFDAARAFGWEPALAAACGEVEARLGVRLPEPLSRRSVAVHSPATRKGGPGRAWNELSTLPFRGRAALVRGHLFPSPEYVRWRYRPRRSWSWPVYYPFRWFQLCLSVMALAVRARRSGPQVGRRS